MTTETGLGPAIEARIQEVVAAKFAELVESNAKALSGGVAIDAPDPGDPAAPMLTLDGFALFGGIAVGARAVDAAFA